VPDIACAICWRRDNLSEAQLNDPANRMTGTFEMCPEHEALFQGAYSTLAGSIIYLDAR
jgi:hypothetical protein